MESVSLQNGIISARIALLGAELLELNNSANYTILW